MVLLNYRQVVFINSTFNWDLLEFRGPSKSTYSKPKEILSAHKNILTTFLPWAIADNSTLTHQFSKLLGHFQRAIQLQFRSASSGLDADDLGTKEMLLGLNRGGWDDIKLGFPKSVAIGNGILLS